MSWKATEPLRLRLYPVLVALVAVLVSYGLIDNQNAALWLALAAAVLGVGTVESVRSNVVPVKVHEQAVQTALYSPPPNSPERSQ